MLTQLAYKSKAGFWIRKYWRFLTAPSSLDPDTAKKEYMSKVIMTVLTLLLFLSFPFLIVTYIIDPDKFSIGAPVQGMILGVLCLTGIYASKKGFWYQTNFVIALILTLFGASDAYTYGITSIAYVENSLALALSVYLLSTRIQLFFLTFIIITNIVLVKMSAFTPDILVENTAFIAFAIFIPMYYITLFSLLTFFKREFNRSLHDLRKYSARLKKQIERRKIIEKELIKAKHVAEESEKAKEELFVNMSHEIRTPLHVITGLLDLLADTKLNKEQTKYTSNLKLASSNLLVIIGDILDFSKASAGEITFEKTQFSVTELMKNILTSFEVPINDKNLKISCTIDPKIPPFLIGDSFRLKQILTNLLSNAIKFTKRGSVDCTASLSKVENERVLIEISVKDTGIGIPKGKIKEIFESYKQADSSISREYGGTGLGLAIVKKLTVLQGGEVSVESTPKIGSTFKVKLWFDIPEIDKTESEKNLTRPITKKTKLTGLKVLVVEDNLLNVLVIEKMLKNIGLEITVCKDSVSALSESTNQKFDLILMDIQMPIVDGYTIAKEIQGQKNGLNTNTPIIAMSAHALEREKDKAKKVGMRDYITKPFTQEILLNKISQSL